MNHPRLAKGIFVFCPKLNLQPVGVNLQPVCVNLQPVGVNLQPVGVNLGGFKLWLCDLTAFIVLNIKGLRHRI